jgi:6-phosphogluconolactonase (cycloisomerase 2 family)
MGSPRAYSSDGASSAAWSSLVPPQGGHRTTALYANVGAELIHCDVGIADAQLIRRDSVMLPATVQYAWPHHNRRYLYVASSENKPGSAVHHVTAFRIDPMTGALNQIGDPIRLPARPIHMTLDNESRHILAAFNAPSMLRVYRIKADFTPGPEVAQSATEVGFFAHQLRATPDGRHVVMVTRGNEPTPQNPGDPGALYVFDYHKGVVSNPSRIAPGDGHDYGPRHLDFHPVNPWMYVSIETQNRIHMHRMQGGKPLQEVIYSKTMLLEPIRLRSRQAASALHVHPNGRFLYGANRSQDLVDFDGRKVYKGGENSIVVYALDPQTGEPTAIQHIETQKFHPRTFHIDASGRILVAQHNLPVNVRDGDIVKSVSAGLSVFRVGTDGRLAFARTCDFEVGDKIMWWMGMVTL